jgi:hypothetical protein
LIEILCGFLFIIFLNPFCELMTGLVFDGERADSFFLVLIIADWIEGLMSFVD